jgi:hypothetical protein
MTSFVILANGPDIIAGIQRVYATDYFQYSDGEWFVADEGVTAQEVHRKIAVDPNTGEQSRSTVVVCTIAGYYGVARKDLWEWMSAKGNAVRHASA